MLLSFAGSAPTRTNVDKSHGSRLTTHKTKPDSILRMAVRRPYRNQCLRILQPYTPSKADLMEVNFADCVTAP
jgi:hypothetical protein